MTYCKLILLCSIVTIFTKASDYCTYGPEPFETVYSGEYRHTGTTYNGDKVYELTNVGNQCENYKLYRSNNRWYFGQMLGGAFTARCQSETTLPSDCTIFERSTALDGVAVSTGSCPVFGCSNIRVTGSGRSDCDGVFIKCDANIYRRSCDPNYSQYNSPNWAFSNKRRKFYCTNTDPRNDCYISGIGSQQKTAEFLVMNDGESRSVTLSSYFNGGYQDQIALFECGVQITRSPTSNPTIPVTNTDICLCNPSGYYFSNGEYYDRKIEFNGKPTYKMTNKYGSEYYIYYVVSGLDGYWLTSQRPPIMNEINYIVPYLGNKNEQDPVIALGNYASYGRCSCGTVIV